MKLFNKNKSHYIFNNILENIERLYQNENIKEDTSNKIQQYLLNKLNIN